MTQRFSFVASRLSVNLLEEGAFCHFNDPATGDPLYLPGATLPDGSKDPAKKVGAYVRSTASKIYDAHVKRVTRRAIAENRKAKTELARQEVVVAQLEKERPEGFAVLVARFLNTSVTEPGEWEPSAEEKMAIAMDPHQSSIVSQVQTFAEESTNYPAEEIAAEGNAEAA